MTPDIQKPEEPADKDVAIVTPSDSTIGEGLEADTPDSGAIGMIGLAGSGKTALLVATRHCVEDVPGWDMSLKHPDLVDFVGSLDELWRATKSHEWHKDIRLFNARRRIWKGKFKWLGIHYLVSMPETPGELIRVLGGGRHPDDPSEEDRSRSLCNYLAACGGLVALLDSSLPPNESFDHLQTLEGVMTKVISQRVASEPMPVAIALTKGDAVAHETLNIDKQDSRLFKYLETKDISLDSVGIRSKKHSIEFVPKEIIPLRPDDSVYQQAIALDFIRCRMPSALPTLENFANNEEMTLGVFLLSSWGHSLARHDSGGQLTPKPSEINSWNLFLPVRSVLDRLYALRQQRRLRQVSNLVFIFTLAVVAFGPVASRFLVNMAHSRVEARRYLDGAWWADWARKYPFTRFVEAPYAPERMELLGQVQFTLARAYSEGKVETGRDIDLALIWADHALDNYPQPEIVENWQSTLAINEVEKLDINDPSLAFQILHRHQRSFSRTDLVVRKFDEVLERLCNQYRQKAIKLTLSSDAPEIESLRKKVHQDRDKIKKLLDDGSFSRTGEAVIAARLQRVIERYSAHIIATESLLELAKNTGEVGANEATFRKSGELIAEAKQTAIRSGTEAAVRDVKAIEQTIINHQINAYSSVLVATRILDDGQNALQTRRIQFLDDLAAQYPSCGRKVKEIKNGYKAEIVAKRESLSQSDEKRSIVEYQDKVYRNVLAIIGRNETITHDVDKPGQILKTVMAVRDLMQQVRSGSVPDAEALRQILRLPQEQQIDLKLKDLATSVSIHLRSLMRKDTTRPKDIESWSEIAELLSDRNEDLQTLAWVLRIAEAFSNNTVRDDPWSITQAMKNVTDNDLQDEVFLKYPGNRKLLLQLISHWAKDKASFGYVAAFYRGLGRAQRNARSDVRNWIADLRFKLRSHIFVSHAFARMAGRRNDLAEVDRVITAVVQDEFEYDGSFDNISKLFGYLRANSVLVKSMKEFVSAAKLRLSDVERDRLLLEDMKAIRSKLTMGNQIIDANVRKLIEVLGSPSALEVLQAVDRLRSTIKQYSLLFVQNANIGSFYLAKDELTVGQLKSIVRRNPSIAFEMKINGRVFAVGPDGSLSADYRERIPSDRPTYEYGAFAIDNKTALAIANAVECRLPTEDEWRVANKKGDIDLYTLNPPKKGYTTATGPDLQGWGDHLTNTGHRGMYLGLREWVSISGGRGYALLGSSWYDGIEQSPYVLTDPEDWSCGLADVGLRLAVDVTPVAMTNYLTRIDTNFFGGS